jgi:hypothetical protein
MRKSFLAFSLIVFTKHPEFRILFIETTVGQIVMQTNVIIKLKPKLITRTRNIVKPRV